MSYKQSIVSFVDILGFRSLVADEANFAKINSALNELKSFTEFETDQIDVFEQSFTNFSDCCVRSTPLLKSDSSPNTFGILFHEIFSLGLAQLQLLVTESILIRGAVSFGDITHDKNRVFGPALVKAYELESEEAVYPRIILDPLVMEKLRNSSVLHSENDYPDREVADVEGLLQKADDGYYFIDYLKLGVAEVDPASLLIIIQNHKDIINRELTNTSNSQNVRDKYLWLKDYHNASVSKICSDSSRERTGLERHSLTITS